MSEQTFTLVFEGSLRAMKRNPLTTETPFGIACGVSRGDVLEEADLMRAALEQIEMDVLNRYDMAELARNTLAKIDAEHKRMATIANAERAKAQAVKE